MTARAHLSLPLYQQDQNVVLSWAQVRVYEADGLTLFKGTLYRDASSTLTYPNPYVLAPALVELWFDGPVRVVLGVQPDRSSIETLTPALDVTADADELVTTASPLRVGGQMVSNGLLRADSSSTGFWFQPGLSPHDHHGAAPDTTRVGPHNPLSSLAADFPGTTSVGAQNEAYAAPENTAPDQTGESMIGYSAFALGRDALALGVQSHAVVEEELPLITGAISVGYRAIALDGSVSLGREAGSASAAEHGVQLGRSAQSRGDRGTALGPYSAAAEEAVALGFNAYTSGVGEVGLPQASITDELAELAEQIELLVPGALQVLDDAHIGSRSGTIGFFGRPAVALQDVGEDEPATGIEALDNLIFALRDLGLLRKRAAPVFHYDAAALRLTDGVTVPEWDSRTGGNELLFNGRAPTFNKVAPVFNSAPSVSFTAAQGLSETDADPSVTHYVTVAAHVSTAVSSSEGLITLRPVDVDDVRTQVLNAQNGAKPTVWSPAMSTYELDGMDQSVNRRIQADGKAHVYRATLNGGWPGARVSVGKAAPLAPGWNGQVARVIGLDDTWSETQTQSLTDGLAFQYHVGQDDSLVLNAAQAYLASAQDGTGVAINFDRVAVTARPTTVSGSVVIPGSVTIPNLPTVTLDTHCRWPAFSGRLSGIWRALDQLLHLIEVYILPTPTTPIASQYRIGRFEMDALGRWSTGLHECPTGYKYVRCVRRSDFVEVPANKENLNAGLDAQVAVYTRVGATRTLQAKVPLRPDKTFFATITGTGQVEADLIGITNTSTVYGTSVRPVAATTRGSDTAVVADLALSCLAMLNLGTGWHYRVQQTLNRLLAIQAGDGLLAFSLSIASPLTSTGDKLTSTNALVAIAALRYEQVTGDAQFHSLATGIGTALAARINGAHLITSGASSGTACLTVDAVLAYWMFSVLADSTHALQLYGTLASTYWNASLGRFHNGTSANGLTPDTLHNLWTDLWTALYCDAVGDSRAALVRKAQAVFRLRNRQPGGPLPLYPSTTLYPSPTLYPSAGG